MDSIDLKKRNFFNTAIADIYRALDGGSKVGAFILTFCLIDNLAWIEYGYKQKIFIKWVTKRLEPLKIFYQYKAEELYSIRCGLVHSYGPSQKMLKNVFPGFLLYDCSPEMHLQRINTPILKVCLYSLLTDTVYAAHQMFEEYKVKQKPKQIERLDKQIKIQRTNPPDLYSKMHRALSVFDQIDPITLNDIKADYTEKILYKK